MARFLFSAFADEASPAIPEQIKACQANGIDYIELRNVNGKNISEITAEEAKMLAQELSDGGIGVISLGSPYGKIEITDDFEEHFEKFKNTVEVAKILGAKYIRIFSFYFKNGESFDEYKDEVFRRIGILADYAKENGVLCCHENEKGIYGDIPERCLEIAEHFGDRLGCVFDPANYIQCGAATPDAFDKLEKYITYMHIKDVDSQSGAVVPAGEGDGEIEEILRRLDKKEGRITLSVEPHLRVFDGLSNLEADGEVQRKMDPYTYPDNMTSFAAACSAIHKIVCKVQPVRIGIIGQGNMGADHHSKYCEGCWHEARVTAVADPVEVKTDAALKRDRHVKTFKDGQELIDSGEVDAVIIATPHYLHPVLAIEAFHKGLHVMSEKPAGVYTKAVREMNEEAAKSGKVFGIMFNQRTNHTFQKVRQMVKSGEYGEIRRVSWIITDWYRTQAYYNSGGWRATWAGEGGGVLLNQCPHNLDLWQWICGMPSKIRAVCHEGKWHDIEVEDDVTIYAEYPNGATGTFITSTGDCPGDNRLEITMDKATIICEDGARIKICLLDQPISKHCANSTEGFAKINREWKDVETDGINPGHKEVVSKFAAAIAHGAPLVAGGEEGINGLTISNAAHLSSWLKKDIELPIDEDLYWSELQKKIAAGKAEKENVNETVQGDMSSTFGA
ncbi:MAG: TIM barrel protein [Clostridiales bacterium]|nr:TIM barrel protein [Clostridiales bacterium]